MTIIKLVMTQKRGYRYEQQVTSYHINKEVAQKYVQERIKEGFDETTTFWNEDFNDTFKVTRHYGFYPDYEMIEIPVNEG